MPVKSQRHETGFSLIEVLIALLVLAIGLLGMASLMLTSMQSNQGAAQRSAAVVLAYDLVERMRSNRNYSQDPPQPFAVDASHPYEKDPLSVADPCPTDDKGTPDDPSDDTPGCPNGMTNAQQAQHDLREWGAQLSAAIPGSTAVINQPTNNQFCIVIFWPVNQDDLVAANDNQPCGQNANGRAFSRLDVEL